MATSEVEVANSALIKLGADTILSLDDDVKGAKLIKKQLPLLRDELLRSHPWNFAIKRVELAEDVTAPISGFTNQYVLPQDVLRVLTVNDGTIGDSAEFTNRVAIHPYTIENNRRLLAELNPLFIKYVAKVTAVNLWDVNFVEVLALRIAADIAYAMTQSTTVQSGLFNAYQSFLIQARSFDGQEGQSVQQVTASEWLDARN